MEVAPPEPYSFHHVHNIAVLDRLRASSRAPQRSPAAVPLPRRARINIGTGRHAEMIEISFSSRLDLANEARALLPSSIAPFIVTPEVASPVITIHAYDPSIRALVRDALQPLFAQHDVSGFVLKPSPRADDIIVASTPSPTPSPGRKRGAGSLEATVVFSLDPNDSLLMQPDELEILLVDSQDSLPPSPITFVDLTAEEDDPQPKSRLSSPTSYPFMHTERSAIIESAGGSDSESELTFSLARALADD